LEYGHRVGIELEIGLPEATVCYRAGWIDFFGLREAYDRLVYGVRRQMHVTQLGQDQGVLLDRPHALPDYDVGFRQLPLRDAGLRRQDVAVRLLAVHVGVGPAHRLRGIRPARDKVGLAQKQDRLAVLWVTLHDRQEHGDRFRGLSLVKQLPALGKSIIGGRQTRQDQHAQTCQQQ
jgi:hypothetical protein